MANAVGLQLLQQVLSGFIPNVTSLVINATDKVGFDLDTTGRKRHILWMEESARSAYERRGVRVNIAMWNMHLEEDHWFGGILDTGLCKMGNGGGFRIVVFRGTGWLQNKGARGFDNWCCSGNQSQNGNLISFKSQF
ncbi:unnamed protein product [Calypogeia fissa]